MAGSSGRVTGVTDLQERGSWGSTPEHTKVFLGTLNGQWWWLLEGIALLCLHLLQI
jgi:hypothetical protein